MRSISFREDFTKHYATRLNLKVLGVFGFLVDSSQLENRRKKLTVQVLHFIARLSHATFCIGSLVETYRSLDNTDLLFDCILSNVVVFKAIAKFVSLEYFKEQYLDILRSMEEITIGQENRMSSSEILVILKELRSSRKFVLALWYGFIPMISVLLVNITPDPEEVQDTENFHPAWYSPTRFSVPFQSAHSPYYGLRISYSLLCGVVAIFIMVFTNSFFLLLLLYMRMLFASVAESFINAAEVSTCYPKEDKSNDQQESTKTKKYPSEENINDINLVLDTTRREDDFIQSIKKHQEILELFKRLNSLLSPIMLTHILTAAMVIAVLGFSLLLAKDRSVFIQGLGLLVFFTLETGLLCWLGDRLTTQSEMIDEAASTAWYNRPASQQRDLVTVLMCSQTPAKITIGPFGSLSLELFGKILNTAYSYYTIMGSMVKDINE